MQIGQYDHDEALRVTAMTFMYEGHTYVFRVSNSGGRFMLMLEKHILPGMEEAVCKHISDTHGDPCAETGRVIKDVAHECIWRHTKICHFLKTVK